jgi:putative hemin transport protein
MTDCISESGQGRAPRSLAQRWAALSDKNPHLRQREAAAQLGVSEGRLVASRLGSSNAVVLAPRWLELLSDMEAVGPVMALTRNAHCVIEKIGFYRNVSPQAGGAMGQVLDEGIDLRLFLNSWGSGFACRVQSEHGPKRSLQFYSPGGEAVHKIHLTADSNGAAFDDLVSRYAQSDQVDPFDPAAVDPPPPSEKPDDEVDVEALLSGWEGLVDTHEFFMLLRRVGATRTQALRLGSPRWAERVELGSWRHALDEENLAELPLMAFVGSRGVIQIHTGKASKSFATGDWFNVTAPGFTLHLCETGVAEAWVVRKPTEGVVVTSLELYDAQGRTVALFFAKRPEAGQPPPARWTDTLASLARV